MSRPLPKTGGRGGGGQTDQVSSTFLTRKLKVKLTIFVLVLTGFEVRLLISHRNRMLSPTLCRLNHPVTPKAQLQGNPRKIYILQSLKIFSAFILGQRVIV